MIEMCHGDTIIKVMPDRVAEMQRKGWKVVGDEPAPEIHLNEEDDNGDSYGF